MKAFIDFYKEEKISPVSQDISDLEQHFRRRSALYRHMGMTPGCVRDKTVLEFGPGSGHNSIHTASLGPARYKLVEGNPTGIESIQTLFEEHVADRSGVEIVESLIEEYEDDFRYDVVLCEGLLPLQEDPVGVLAHVAQFVAPGGILVVTCTDSVSYLAELLRKLFAYVLTNRDDSTEEKLAVLLPVFSPQLAQIEGMSRPHRDYILDNIIQPFEGRSLFGMDQAIETVRGSLSFYGVSPQFYTDWRWYKKITGPASEFNDRGLESYRANVHNLLDSRTDPVSGEPELNAQLLEKCDHLYHEILSFESDRDNSHLASIASNLDWVRDAARKWDPLTATSIEEFSNNLKRASDGERTFEWGSFAPWFGQAQLYVSFLKDS